MNCRCIAVTLTPEQSYSASLGHCRASLALTLLDVYEALEVGDDIDYRMHADAVQYQNEQRGKRRDPIPSMFG